MENLIEKIKQLSINRPKEWRYGQAVFNIAYILFPEETDTFRGTSRDCYYDDNKVDIFLETLNNLVNE